MESINSDLIKNLKDLNLSLKSKINNLDGFSKNQIRKKLLEFGRFVDLKKLSEIELRTFNKMACVDGSNNRFGASHPHYIDIFQGLAKFSTSIEDDIFLSEVYSPIYNQTYSEIEDGDKRDKLLARIEILTGLKAANTNKINFLLMDGNLIRYKIKDENNYIDLKDTCLTNNIILSGYIKEPNTCSLLELIYEEEIDFILGDKDILYGVLNIGEAYVLKDNYNRKINDGIYSIFLRTSNYPGISSIEILIEQRDEIFNIANLCYNLTPEMSRGVPLIIDMVDKEVKINDKLVNELISSYLDKDITERFFRSERSMRT